MNSSWPKQRRIKEGSSDIAKTEDSWPKLKRRKDETEISFQFKYFTATELAGATCAAQIIREHQETTLMRGSRDRLMFTWTVNGEFTVKKAYQLLIEAYPGFARQARPQEISLWRKIWKTKGVLPRVRIFFWKALQGALPTAIALSRRIPAIKSECNLCGGQLEDAVHIIFMCPHAPTWFASPLALRATRNLQGALKEILCELWKELDEKHIAFFMMLAWRIWKARCSVIFNDAPAKPEETLRATMVVLRALDFNAQISASIKGSDVTSVSPGLSLVSTHIPVAWVDGSFDDNERGGGTFILFMNKVLIRFQVQGYEKGIPPFHMEACALLMAMQAAIDLQLEECVFCTNCKLLADSLDRRRRFLPLQAVGWRSYKILVNAANILAARQNYCCVFITIDENQMAHQLVNRAQIELLASCGCTFPTFKDMAH